MKSKSSFSIRQNQHYLHCEFNKDTLKLYLFNEGLLDQLGQNSQNDFYYQKILNSSNYQNQAGVFSNFFETLEEFYQQIQKANKQNFLHLDNNSICIQIKVNDKIIKKILEFQKKQHNQIQSVLVISKKSLQLKLICQIQSQIQKLKQNKSLNQIQTKQIPKDIEAILKCQIDNLQKRRTELQKDNCVLMQKFNQRQQQLKKIKVNHDQLIKQLEQSKVFLVAKDKQIVQRKNFGSNLQSQINKLKSEYLKKEKKTQKLQKYLLQSKQKLKIDKQKHDEKYKNLQSQNSKLKKQIKSISTKIQRNQEFQLQKRQCAHQQNVIQQIEKQQVLQQIPQNQMVIDHPQKDRIYQLQSIIQRQKQELQSKDKQIQTLKNQIQVYALQIQQYQQHNAQLMKQCENKKDKKLQKKIKKQNQNKQLEYFQPENKILNNLTQLLQKPILPKDNIQNHYKQQYLTSQIVEKQCKNEEWALNLKNKNNCLSLLNDLNQSNLNKLTRLNLQNNQIGDSGWMLLIKIQFFVLKVLYLGSNKLRSLQSINKMNMLEQLSLADNGGSSSNQLTSLTVNTIINTRWRSLQSLCIDFKSTFSSLYQQQTLMQNRQLWRNFLRNQFHSFPSLKKLYLGSDYVSQNTMCSILQKRALRNLQFRVFKQYSIFH